MCCQKIITYHFLCTVYTDDNNNNDINDDEYHISDNRGLIGNSPLCDVIEKSTEFVIAMCVWWRNALSSHVLYVWYNASNHDVVVVLCNILFFLLCDVYLLHTRSCITLTRIHCLLQNGYISCMKILSLLMCGCVDIHMIHYLLHVNVDPSHLQHIIICTVRIGCLRARRSDYIMMNVWCMMYVWVRCVYMYVRMMFTCMIYRYVYDELMLSCMYKVKMCMEWWLVYDISSWHVMYILYHVSTSDNTCYSIVLVYRHSQLHKNSGGRK